MLNIKTEEEYITIVEMFSDMIFRIAYQNLFDTHDAEDVVQDVFLKLFSLSDKEFIYSDNFFPCRSLTTSHYS